MGAVNRRFSLLQRCIDFCDWTNRVRINRSWIWYRGLRIFAWDFFIGTAECEASHVSIFAFVKGLERLAPHLTIHLQPCRKMPRGVGGTEVLSFFSG